MKKLLLLSLALLFILPITTKAQERNSNTERLKPHSILLEDLDPPKKSDTKHSFMLGVSDGSRYGDKTPYNTIENITYLYRFYRGLSVGATLSSGVVRYLHNNEYLTSFIVEFRWSYYNSELVELYSSLGAGIRHSTKKPTTCTEFTWFPTADIKLIGVKLGKNVGGFTELGYGAKGIINLGVYFNF